MSFLRGIVGFCLMGAVVGCAASGSSNEASPLVTAGAQSVEVQARQLQRIQAAGQRIVDLYRTEISGDATDYSPAVTQAMETVLAQDFERCTPEYRAIPIEGGSVGGPGDGLIAVYLIPEPGDPVIMPIGGFHRYTVDADSGQIVHRTPLSNGCRTLSLSPDDDAGPRAAVRSLLVNHSRTLYPLESHVFASLTYDVELVVITDQATWQVENGRIRALN